jgi:hypothetical protein
METTMKTSEHDRFLISPCGYKCDWFAPGTEPADWTDVTDLSDDDMDALVARRIRATQLAELVVA